jgi:hypothetical protein
LTMVSASTTRRGGDDLAQLYDILIPSSSPSSSTPSFAHLATLLHLHHCDGRFIISLHGIFQSFLMASKWADGRHGRESVSQRHTQSAPLRPASHRIATCLQNTRNTHPISLHSISYIPRRRKTLDLSLLGPCDTAH